MWVDPRISDQSPAARSVRAKKTLRSGSRNERLEFVGFSPDGDALYKVVEHIPAGHRPPCPAWCSCVCHTAHGIKGYENQPHQGQACFSKRRPPEPVPPEFSTGRPKPPSLEQEFGL